jgi:HEAT repeat protein
LLVHQGYGQTLRQTIKRRSLGEVELSVADGASLAAVNRLLQSNELHEVQLALDMLETAVFPTYPDQLLQLASHAQPAIQIEALHRIERHQQTAALPLVTKLAEAGGETAVQGAALQTLCALAEAEAVALATPYLNHHSTAVRHGALVGLLRYGGISGIIAAAPYLDEAQQAATVADRVLAAQVIGGVARQNFYEPLLTLLQDPAKSVRQAALEAAAQVRHQNLLPHIIRNLHDTATRSAALAALQAYGSAILPLTAVALDGETAHSSSEIKRLVRVCGEMGGADVVALLRQHLAHPHSEIQEQVAMALSLCGFQAEAADQPTIQHNIQQQATYAATLLAVQRDALAEAATDAGAATLPLQQAVQDEQNRVRRRLFLWLALLYDNQAILRAEEQLSKGQEGAQALAMELLDVTLAPAEKELIFPLIDPQLTLAQRLQRLPSSLAVPRQDQETWLADIMTNRTELWGEGWLRACAIYAAGKLGMASHPKMHEWIVAASRQPESVAGETAVWVLDQC